MCRGLKDPEYTAIRMACSSFAFGDYQLFGQKSVYDDFGFRVGLLQVIIDKNIIEFVGVSHFFGSLCDSLFDGLGAVGASGNQPISVNGYLGYNVLPGTLTFVIVPL